MLKESINRSRNRSDRQRAVGGGRKLKLTLGESLFLLLLYYRTYVNHAFIAMLGGIDDRNVCRYFKKISPLLSQFFKVPEHKVQMSQNEILTLIIDATEQPTQKRKGSVFW